MERDAAERCVGDGGATECEVKVREHGEAEGEDFGRSVGQGTAK
jgi:hypothetical protein